MNVQWYPGHMTKAKRMMQEDMKLVDLVMEILDARVPCASRNPDINELAGNKARLVLLNKSDLADEKKTAQWKQRLEAEGMYAALINSRNGKGVRAVHEIIKEACREKLERDQKKGIKNRPVRAMVVGIPNVGKSTFINSFAGKACTKTGNKPGVTKGKQWIRLNKDVELLDTPGILWPKFEDPKTGLLLALIGSIKDEIMDITELAVELLKLLIEEYPQTLADRYGAELGESDNLPLSVLEQIAVRRSCLLKGGGLDYDRAAALLMEEFRSGRLGRISLE